MIKISFTISIFCAILLTAQASLPDSVITGTLTYNSFGFNASTVSGLGLSYRHHSVLYSLIQVSGGIIKTTDNIAYSAGVEYQYELSRRTDFRYYICLGSGLYNSGGSSGFVGGFGVGFDTPVFGHTVKENMTAGISLFYPTIYSGTSETTISFGASVYFFYNF